MSVGGLVRPRPSFVSIGIDIIRNHHVLTETLYAKHLLTAGNPVRRLTESARPDEAFVATLGRLPTGCTPGFGRAVAEALIDRSSYEGAEVYRTIRAAADRRYSRVGVRFDEGEDPDRALRPGADLTRFYALEAAGVRRARDALDAWWTHFSSCAALDA